MNIAWESDYQWNVSPEIAMNYLESEKKCNKHKHYEHFIVSSSLLLRQYSNLFQVFV